MTPEPDDDRLSRVRRLIRWLGLLVVGLVILPPLINLVLADDGRTFEAVELEETVHTEVRFRNDEQGLDLAGLLFQPSGEGPFPAAVIIQGSGTSSRDNGWYLTVADHLQQNGIAVLLPDKRGSEESEGDWRTASFDDLATDTVAAIAYLSGRSDLAIESIGVVGMSQGGRIAPLVAAADPGVAWGRERGEPGGDRP